ncbi:MAG: conjugal transfer protein TraF [Deltaproteobacteria bacterium]|nr:conjugal transfer protein TraF [Deltaproteobacteria bacterium]
MKFWLSILICATYVLTASNPAVSGEDSPAVLGHSGYGDAIQKGWYWYEVEKERKEEPAAEEDSPPPFDTTMDPWSMSVEEFKILLEKTKNDAVANPTIENMLKYIEMQDMARRKALAFANVYQLVMQKHPEFTTASTNPTAVPGIDALHTMKSEEVESEIYAAKNDFALVYFHKPDCQFCRAQNGVLRYFTDKYGWSIKAVNLYDEPEPAYRFNVTTVPYILTVYKATGEYMPVTVGVASLNELEQKLYRAIRYLRGEVTPSQFSIYNYDLGGPGDPEQRGNRQK